MDYAGLEKILASDQATFDELMLRTRDGMWFWSHQEILEYFNWMVFIVSIDPRAQDLLAKIGAKGEHLFG